MIIRSKQDYYIDTVTRPVIYISKTLERLVCSQQNNYLNTNNILNKYTLYISTETALTHILDKIRLFPTQHPSTIVLLDLSAAFDKIDHTILLHHLESIGLSGVVLTWFTSYLSDRTYSI